MLLSLLPFSHEKDREKDKEKERGRESGNDDEQDDDDSSDEGGNGEGGSHTKRKKHHNPFALRRMKSKEDERMISKREEKEKVKGEKEKEKKRAKEEKERVKEEKEEVRFALRSLRSSFFAMRTLTTSLHRRKRKERRKGNQRRGWSTACGDYTTGERAPLLPARLRRICDVCDFVLLREQQQDAAPATHTVSALAESVMRKRSATWAQKKHSKIHRSYFTFCSNEADREIKMNGYRQPKSRFKTCLWWVGLLPTGFVFGLVGTPRNGQLGFV